ncbi:asparagine synthase-related protein [Massilia endophytica]|uniref:asparagine synthase-related protein n=1 Tax=Massilia endophytica TaxID=2899220 RepID=UPI001E2B34BF|nr:asparagine synthase-related protein [Massilia endophytica]UGQ46933.1 asparagine synthase-related protein [Massilia endophytica]
MDTPYCFARRRAAGFSFEGSTSCTLGQRVGDADGIWAWWSWDGAQLTAANERYGLYPLYCYSAPDAVGLSTSIPRLIALGADTALDYGALAVFLRLGFFIGDDTPFRHIRAVPPAASLGWDGTLRLHCSGRAAPRPAAMRRHAVVDAYIDLFRQSIARRAPQDKEWIMPLSGGRDSRHILFELLRQGHRPALCLTTEHFPPRGAEDVRVAGVLARELGLSHVVLPQPSCRFEAELRKNLLTGFCSDEHAWYLAAMDYLKRQGRPVYDGIGGDVLSAGLFVSPRSLALFGSCDPHAIANGLLDADEEALAGLLPAQLLRRMSRELAVEHLGAEVARHLDGPNPIASFYFWNRTRREIALVPYGLLGGLPQVHAPYLDHALFDLLASLPLAMVADHTLHSEAIARAYPEWAHLPYENKQALSPSAAALDARFARRLARSLLARPSPLVRGGFLWPRLLGCLASERVASGSGWYASLALYLHQLGVQTQTPPAKVALRAEPGALTSSRSGIPS